VNGRFYRYFGDDEGVAVAEEDWDNLLILDACRYDMFEETIGDFNLSGDLSMRRSLGSASVEFLRDNFVGRELYDTVYITANAWVKTEVEECFHHVDHVWIDGWDETEETVPPEVVCDRALEARAKFPNKRLIVHFMQPHFPFIGETRIERDRGYVWARETAIKRDADSVHNVWELLRKGVVNEQSIWDAYTDNLELVLKQCVPLVEELSGKTVITSDHGNAFGERARPIPFKVYGHEGFMSIPELIEVPWFEIEVDKSRPEITAEPPSTTSEVDDVDENEVESRLEDLGYAD